MFNFKAILRLQVLLAIAWVAAVPGPLPAASLQDAISKDLSLVFCTRLPYADGHWYANIGYYSTNEQAKAYFGNGKPDKSVLYRYHVASKERRVIFDAQGGGIRDPAVHYDGKTILFSYRPNNTDYYNLYTIQSDGSNLRQITSGVWDDYEACWLPDGGIVFVSTRCKRWVGCWYTQVGVLYRCNADGSGIKQLSANIEHDNTPCVLPDGRILFMRWEYVDRSQVEYHALWTMNPDGTAVNIYYGNMHSWIAMLDPQAIPDTQEVIASFSPGHGANEHRGPPTIVSPLRGPDCKESATRIGKRHDIRDPFPLSKDIFLMACWKNILLMDRNGNEVTLYTDPELNVHEPRPLLPRPREKVVPARFPNPTSTEGQFVLQNVYVGRNMAGVNPGDIKKLLVLEVLPKPANFSGGMDLTSNLGTFNLERVLGTVPVEADGSASFIAPSGRPIFFVALDKDDLSVKRMNSFCNLMAGESYTCVGCHEERSSTADTKPAPPTLLALKRQPSRIQKFEGFPDVFDYQRDIQPVLDRNCVTCHNAEKRAGRMDLSAGLSVRFSKSYMALLLRRLVVDGANGLGNRVPRSVGSSASPLLTYMRNGHKGTKVSEKDWRTVWLWIESGALYAGSCAGIRNEDEQDYYGVAWGHAGHGIHTVANKRCASCHKNEPDRNVNGIPFNDHIRREKESKKWGRPLAAYERLTTTNDPARFFDITQLVNLTNPEQSAFLRVPLAKAAGGLEHHGHAIFKDKNDPDYQFALACIQRGQKVYADRPAWGMQGWKPNKDYIREMKRFGILPPLFDRAKDDFDPFKTDQQYWRSLWPSLEKGTAPRK